MFVGIYTILIAIIFIAVGMRWSENMAKRFGELGSEVDPALFKIAFWMLGLAGLVFGIVKLTAALR